jgi:hypothetical protein
VAFERVEDDAIVGECIRRPGPRLERGGNEAQGVDRAALLVTKYPKQMQRIEVSRVCRERAVVKPFRLFEMSPLMQSKRLFDAMYRLRVLRGRVLICGWRHRQGFCDRRSFFVSAAIAHIRCCRCPRA